MHSSEDLEKFYFQPCLIKNPSNRFVLRTKFLIAFFKNGKKWSAPVPEEFKLSETGPDN